ncbi:fatty acyl-CoA reductase [Alkalimarinus alittae]|uniref:Fatty acyl-CoA reductase n=1 Tax=Alkalimarinus alittae TaxID=2961619 RepID=A0ABY6MZU1_9ALTE|nr:fatty acyl-CoA reductase [Alkalimarinus alittae]UZE95363.1 fatty acyl-CoA reductase [Alkalimarinus alittae]
MMNKRESEIKKQLANKRLLITGCTGFLGKVLLEKIIREVPEVASITLLIRGSRSYPTAEERFKHEIASASIFDALREKDSAALDQILSEKVRCITGEITEENFGLGSVEWNDLSQQVDIIINSAASVNFREPLDQALSINTLSLFNFINFVDAAGNVPLVHVSTCYVNGFNEGQMGEGIVGPTGKQIAKHKDGYYDVESLITEFQQAIEQTKKANNDKTKLAEELTELGARMANLYGWNDVYTFTKWMAEQVLLHHFKGKTLTILRPSIIESTYQEPVGGWIEGVKVADAMIMAYARQKVSFFPGRKDSLMDIIPADFVSNSILYSAAKSFKDPGDSLIYQCCSGAANPITVQKLIDYVIEEGTENYARYDRLFYAKPEKSFNVMNKSMFQAAIGLVVFQANAFYKAKKLLGLKPSSKAIDNLQVVKTLSKIYAFYGDMNVVFNNHKMLNLVEEFGEVDKALFPVDATLIDWKHYIREVHFAGLQKYALEDREVIELRRKKAKELANNAA